MVFAGVYIMDARTEPGPGPLLNRELKAAEGVRAGLGPPLGGSRVVCRFGLFLIDKIASQKKAAHRGVGEAVTGHVPKVLVAVLLPMRV